MRSEDKLLKGLVMGQESAYEELVQKLEKPLMNFIYRFVNDLHTAEDIFQETFVRVVRKISEYRPDWKLSTWIFTIARNCCLDYLKSKKRKRDVSLEMENQSDDSKPVVFKNLFGSKYLTPGESLEKNEDHVKLRSLLSKLTPVKREAIAMRVYLDLSYEEISKITRTPVGTCKYRVYRALQELSDMFNEPTQGMVEQGT